MKKIIPLLLALALSACQSLPSSQDYADVDHLPQTEAAFLKRTKAIQEVAKAQSVRKRFISIKTGIWWKAKTRKVITASLTACRTTAFT